MSEPETIILSIVAIIFIILPFVMRKLHSISRQKMLIREALANTRAMNESTISRIISERAERIRREREIEREQRQELARRRDEFRAEHDPNHPAYIHPMYKKKENKPAFPAMEFLKKEDFEI